MLGVCVCARMLGVCVCVCGMCVCMCAYAWCVCLCVCVCARMLGVWYVCVCVRGGVQRCSTSASVHVGVDVGGAGAGWECLCGKANVLHTVVCYLPPRLAGYCVMWLVQHAPAHHSSATSK